VKKYIPIALLFASIFPVLAIFVSPFRGWDDLVENSPEIFIARCVSTVDFISATKNKPTIVIDDMVDSGVEVVSVLKGSASPGLTSLASQYWPYRGEYFLVFANYKKDEFNAGYSAIEGYRVIPLDHNFMTNQLTGKTLNEQIDLILARRLADLNGEIARDDEERARIEAGLKMHGQTNGVSNSPPKTAEPPPPKARASF